MLLAFVLAHYVDRQAFLFSFSRYLYWLACISLVIFASSIALRPLVDIFPTTVNYGGVEFSNLFVGAVFKDAEILRNTSVFREPGVFALYLGVGIGIELLYKEVPCYRYLAVFFLALLTTFSTAGFAIASVLLIAYLAKKKNVKVFAFGISLAVCAAITLYSFPDLSEQIFSKFSEDSTEFASTLARVSSISVPSLIFAHNPVFGVGLTKFVDQYLIYSEELFGFPISPEGSSTNTVINTFAIYGALLGGVVTLGLLRFANLLAGSRLVAVFVFVALLMMISAQELRFSLFFNILIMLGLVRVRSVVAKTGDQE
nr:O-antigen ligase family protein [Massilia norwichensis]